MRRLFIFVVTILAIGCASRSATPSAQTHSVPQIFQHHGGRQWVIINTGQQFSTDTPIHWYGSGMTALGPPGLTYVNESGHATAKSEPWYSSNQWSGDVVGPDGNLWVSEYLIYSVTPGGQVTTYTPPFNSGPLAVGSDGALWFLSPYSNTFLGRVTISGVFSEIPFQPTESIQFTNMATGSDGNFWATGTFSGIDRITPTGVVTNFPATPNFFSPCLTPGPDGAIWFCGNSFLGRIAVDGTVTEYIMPDGSGPNGMTFTPDGVLWIMDGGATTLYSFNLSTQQFSAAIPTPGYQTGYSNIAAAPDGNLWLTTGYGGTNIAVYLLHWITVTPRSLTLQSGGTGTLAVAETNYGGTWTASASSSFVSVTLTSPGVYTVTANARGKGYVKFKDSQHNYVETDVTVR